MEGQNMVNITVSCGGVLAGGAVGTLSWSMLTI